MPRMLLSVGYLSLAGAALAHNVTILSDAPVNQEITGLLWWVLIFAVIIFGVVAGALAYTIWKFRAKPGDDELPPQVHGNDRMEIIWTAIPLLIVMVLFVLTAQTLVKIKRPVAGSVPIEATGWQFWWDFQYPDEGLRTAGELVIPVGQPVEVKITSGDVIHSFWPPSLTGKADAVPGEDNYLRFMATKPGNYYGYCAELCGASHANMRFRILALEREDYNRFIEAFKAYEAPAPANEPAARGQQLFNAQCAACHTVKGTPARGVIGPDLSLFGMRTTLGSGVWDNTPENLKRWIKDSSAMKPSSKMPPFTQLSDTDLEALAAYLYSLKLDGFDFAQLPRY